MNTNSKWPTSLFGAASTLVATLALLPSVAAAQNLGTYQITGGDLEGPSAVLEGPITGNGFTGSLTGYPLVMYAGGQLGNGGDFDFSMALSPPAGRDQGLYMSLVGPSDLAILGLVPINVSNPLLPYLQETGGITTPLIDITGGGTFSAPFIMSAEVAFGAPGTRVPEGYADFVGAGIVTVDVRPASCNADGACGPLTFADVDYKFAPSSSTNMAPEIDPGSAASGLTLLLGGLLVLRGRRRQPVAMTASFANPPASSAAGG